MSPTGQSTGQALTSELGPSTPEGSGVYALYNSAGLQARSCRGPPECRKPWSIRALPAPSQLQSGLKSIFHSTAPKSPRKPVPFRPPPALGELGRRRREEAERGRHLAALSRPGRPKAGHSGLPGDPLVIRTALSAQSLTGFSGSLRLPVILFPPPRSCLGLSPFISRFSVHITPNSSPFSFATSCV
ncbi:hypothetical protein NN561_010315 [Cricetulus griseus]